MQLARLITRIIDACYVAPATWLLPLQTFRYAACGGLNMVLDAVWYFVLYNFVVAHRFVDLGFVVISPHILSMCLVFPITFFNGFWLNRYVAFRHSPLKSTTQLVRYALSIVGSLLLTYVGLKLLVEVCHIWPTPSKLITTVVTVIYSYFVAKYFTFRGCVAQ
jgi:putative flippase GtrA